MGQSLRRAAGQAVATAHVRTHCMGGAIYALQAIHRTTTATGAAPAAIDDAVARERDWQYQRLVELRK